MRLGLGTDISVGYRQPLFGVVPLLLDTYTGAAAAYSLRQLRTGVTNVVRVRRSSDNAEADFTAAEVSDGTMLSWVNTEVVKYTSDFTSGNEDLGEFNGVGSDGETIDGVSDAYKYTLTGGSVVHFAFFNLPEYNQTYSVTLDYYIPSGQTVTDLEATLATISQHTLDSVGAWTTETFTFVTSDDSSPNNRRIRFVTNDYISIDADGDVFYLKNIVVTQTTADGHVVTWYDQSGNGNDATQATAANQPKIVDAGMLVEENGKPAVLLDGTNDHLVSTNAYPTMAYQSTFYVASSTGTDNRVLDTRGTGTLGTVQGWQHKYSQTSPVFDLTVIDNGSSTNLATTGITRTGKNLVSVFMYGGSGSSIDEYTNGSLSNSVTFVNNIDFDSGNQLYIGANVNGANSQLFGGKIQDIILYNNDQSANRTAIEQNINEHYNIYP